MTKLAIAVVLALTAASAFAAGKAHPVVKPLGGDWGDVLIGGTVDGRWLPASQMAAKLRKGERYRLYSRWKPVGIGWSSKPGKTPLSQPCVKLAPRNDEYEVAIAGDWNALPRVPKRESPKQKVYLDTVREVLASKGLGKSPASIESVLRVDLEGDGRDELIITAQSPGYDMLAPRKGGYSFVMVRMLVRGKPQSILVAGEFHTSSPYKRYSGWEYRAAGLYDLDGDGKLEVSVNMLCQSLDASQVMFYDLQNGRVRKLGEANHGN